MPEVEWVPTDPPTPGDVEVQHPGHSAMWVTAGMGVAFTAPIAAVLGEASPGRCPTS